MSAAAVDPYAGRELTCGERPLLGGAIHKSARWRVEHCVGQLGLATLLVEPLRHVTAVAALTELEASELAPPLARAPAVAACLVDTVKQVHTCAWSHADGRAGHIDYLVEPVTPARLERFDAVGPTLGWMVPPRR